MCFFIYFTRAFSDFPKQLMAVITFFFHPVIYVNTSLEIPKNFGKYLYCTKINLSLFSTVFPSNSCWTVQNKGKLILTEIFPSVQKHDI